MQKTRQLIKKLPNAHQPHRTSSHSDKQNVTPPAAHREHDESSLDNGAPKMKLQLEKERKARNQRRYYQNHKDSQQEKARQRSARNRLLAKQNLWIPLHDDGYNSSDDHPPSLVPVFDPADMHALTLGTKSDNNRLSDIST
ncbi:hypothetical protein PILCRDRAFT_14655 [Piloderma croceum F 1598]|uniref:Uncharacterized protein n=1 Tax=Piloderma croceum (strain F 1598) TaxID=765440 RepID=A0A0C3F2C1_PILCF|nr:hypothetical protein PILCRDRAFT_14655 [Piloderma croceum F 1598]